MPVQNIKPADCLSWQILALCLLCIFLMSSFSASYFYMTVKDFSNKVKTALRPNKKE